MEELKPELIFFSSPVIAWLNEVATVVQSNRKNTNNTSRHFGKKSQNYYLRTKPWEWEHLLRTSLRDLDEKMNLAG